MAGQVKTGNDRAVAKLDKVLRGKLASGSNAQVVVFVTAKGNGAAALKLLARGYAAHRGDGSLVIGRIRAQQLPKLAGAAGVVSVGAIQFAQTGQPDNRPDTGRKVNLKKVGQKVRAAAASDVPYADAPPLATGHFNELKRLNLFDARAHQFSAAWKKGFTGQGATLSVLDGGTDFGHPDLLGTWKTGPSGWPDAYDPFSTLQILQAPDQVVDGLSWYSLTTVAHVGKKGSATVSVPFTSQTGPSRDGDPAGTVNNTYTFPRAWTTSGDVRLANHPDDYLLEAYGQRVGVLVTDPHTPHVYDTVYVDLNNDHDFSDEKPVTKDSPAAYRDLNGDGVTDLSGGLLYYISDGNHGTPLPGGPQAFGANLTFPAGRVLAWSGDYDIGIEGHGTLTASNVVGQGVVNGGEPSFPDVPGKTHTVPGMVIGGAPDAKLLPMGDVYFSFDFSRIFGNFLAQGAGALTTSNSYGDSTLDNDGYDAGSQEMDIVNSLFGNRTATVYSTGNGAPGYGTRTAPAPVTGIDVGASTGFGGTGWDSIANISQTFAGDEQRHPVVEQGPWRERGDRRRPDRGRRLRAG